MVIKNVYKKGFITTSLMNETSTWEQQIFYANKETIELFSHNHISNTTNVIYTINYNFDKQYFYCTYCIDKYKFWTKTYKYFLTEKNKNKLHIKMKNILTDFIRHDKSLSSYYEVQPNALKNFPHFTMDDVTKCFGI